MCPGRPRLRCRAPSATRAREEHLAGREEQQRVEVALHRHAVAEPRARLVQGVRQSTPMTVPPASR
jgi:hypothetical protein